MDTLEAQIIPEKSEDEMSKEIESEIISVMVNSPQEFSNGPLAIHFAEKVKQSGINPKNGQSIKPLVAYVPREKYARLQNRLLNTKIIGESGINGLAFEWKEILLKWLNLKFKVIAWRVSVSKLVGLLRDSGFTFNQDDTKISQVILQWLEIFKAEVESGLELEVNMLIRA